MNQPTNNSKPFSIALWAANYGLNCTTEESWMSCAERQVHKAAASGVSLLIMPEWLSEMWNKLGPYQGTETLDRLRWEAETAATLLPELGEIAAAQGMALLAGTAPALLYDRERWTNRARLFLPDGTAMVQDKIFFTPSEKSIPGRQESEALQIVEWDGIRIGIAICLDSEQSAVSTQLRQADIDLLLIPSLTSTVSGYNRVSTCAKARAIELMCPVATVGSIGVQNVNADKVLNNISGASVFVPCEAEFADGSGVLSNTGLIDNKIVRGDGLLSIVKDVPIERCRELRENSAEFWSREHISRPIQLNMKGIQDLHRANYSGGLAIPEL